jgi:hypothetical protein
MSRRVGAAWRPGSPSRAQGLVSSHEATAMPLGDGASEPGLTLMGRPGDPMKEPAQIALS